MKVYQFIKYDLKTELIHIKNHEDDRLIVCFDFEDGIQNSSCPEKNIPLKEKHREYFTSIVRKLEAKIRIGVRINSNNQTELQKDIHILKNVYIHSIFLPKIESAKQIIEIIEQLKNQRIIYKEIIPIVESRKGLINIQNIIQTDIKNIAFGHCDYNMSLNIMPFFHQENFEYWKWFNQLLVETKVKNICLINSPYLVINNKSFFSSMIVYLKAITENNFGQITLSNYQTELCFTRKNCVKEFQSLLSNRHKLYPSIEYLNDLISNYDKFNTGRGLSKSKSRIISFQEYICAKKFTKNNKSTIISLAFVGGCFPVQHDILYEEMFLSKLKDFVEKEFSVDLQVDIIRYENFATVLDKIQKHTVTKHFDFLIFSIRPEPFLRLIKFYYRYVNNSGKLKHSLNLPYFNLINPEKNDLLMLGRKYNYGFKYQKSQAKNFLVDFNYYIGKLIGNKTYATKKYIELIESIQDHCKNNQTELILLGPNLRGKTSLEPKICNNLDKEIRNAMPSILYIDGLLKSYNRKEIFQENRIHVNKYYHELIAESVYNVLKNKLLNKENLMSGKSIVDKLKE